MVQHLLFIYWINRYFAAQWHSRKSQGKEGDGCERKRHRERGGGKEKETEQNRQSERERERERGREEGNRENEREVHLDVFSDLHSVARQTVDVVLILPVGPGHPLHSAGLEDHLLYFTCRDFNVMPALPCIFTL